MGDIKEMPRYAIRINGLVHEGWALRITEVKIRMGSDIPWSLTLGFEGFDPLVMSHEDWSRVHNDRWNYPRLDDYLITLKGGVKVLIDPKRFAEIAEPR